jgi:hypothetical protein
MSPPCTPRHEPEVDDANFVAELRAAFEADAAEEVAFHREADAEEEHGGIGDAV